jgi:hypothetical protein
MKKLMEYLAVITMVGAFTATTMADFDVYGSSRFRTYYTNFDFDWDGSNIVKIPGVDGDKDLEWRMGLLSRFGVNFKSDKITGKFELDARSGEQGRIDPIEFGSQASRVGNLRLRHLWGEWDFGAGKLMIGQNFPLYDAPVSGINYYSGGLQRFGGIGLQVARTGQIRLTFENLRIAFLPPDTFGSVSPLSSSVRPFENVNTKFPKIEIRYDTRLDNFALNFIGGYQSVEIEDRLNEASPSPFFGTGPGTKATEDIISWVLGFRGRADFGPVYAGLALTYRQNGFSYGVWTDSTKESAVFQGNDLKDATAWGVDAALGWRINDMLTVEASYAAFDSKQDTSLDNEDDAMVWGLLTRITMAPGVYIIPEIIYQDNKDVTNNGVSTDQGDVTVFGVYWRIDFK